MTRPFFLCALALALAACHREKDPMPDVFPQDAGPWHRTALRELRAAEAPDPVPPAGIERIRSASYQGPGKLDVRVYQMSSPAVALDMVQRWHAAPDTVFFYGGRYFAVVRWESAERKALHAFVGVLESKLNAKQ
jgi:hypothetical protein